MNIFLAFSALNLERRSAMHEIGLSAVGISHCDTTKSNIELG